MSIARIIASPPFTISGLNVGLGITPLVRSHVNGDSILNGVTFFKASTPVSKTAAATLTAAEILNGVITFSGTAANLTMPLGSDLDAAIIGGNLPVDTAFDFSIVALSGSGTASLVGNTGVTILAGFQTVGLATSTFRVRKTAAGTFTIYKV